MTERSAPITPDDLVRLAPDYLQRQRWYGAAGRTLVGVETVDFEVLHADNPSVLAYLRSDEHDTVLCVNNLSRFPQPCELMLEELAGMVPIELTGRVPFPPIGELPYFVTLAPHGFYWFSIQDPGEAGDEP